MTPFTFMILAACGSTALAQTPPDDPQISRSRGEAGGVVVLWTRVIPRTEDPAILALATQVQAQVATAAARALPGRPADRRPAPERVCPRSGCLAVSAGALLVHRGGGCAVVLLASRPGPSEARLVPWAGAVTLSTPTVPFREPPEGAIKVTDMMKCDGVAARLAEPSPAVDAALRDAAAP